MRPSSVRIPLDVEPRIAYIFRMFSEKDIRDWMKNRTRKYKKDVVFDITGLVTEWAFKHESLYAISDWDHPVWDAALHYHPEFRKLREASAKNTEKIMKECEKQKLKNASKKPKASPSKNAKKSKVTIKRKRAA